MTHHYLTTPTGGSTMKLRIVLGLACVLGAAFLAGASGSAGKKLRAAVVTDVGGIGDKSFNMMAWKGLQRAGKELGFDVKLAESRERADYEPNLRRLAGQDADVVVAVGFALRDALEKVAP